MWSAEKVFFNYGIEGRAFELVDNIDLMSQHQPRCFSFVLISFFLPFSLLRATVLGKQGGGFVR